MSGWLWSENWTKSGWICHSLLYVVRYHNIYMKGMYKFRKHRVRVTELGKKDSIPWLHEYDLHLSDLSHYSADWTARAEAETEYKLRSLSLGLSNFLIVVFHILSLFQTFSSTICFQTPPFLTKYRNQDNDYTLNIHICVNSFSCSNFRSVIPSEQRLGPHCSQATSGSHFPNDSHRHGVLWLGY
jgi:hypothetical protein